MKLIQTITLTANTKSITFSSIPQDATDLLITLSARMSGTADIVSVQLNNNSSSIYSERRLGNEAGSTTNGSTINNVDTSFLGANHSGTTSNTFSNCQIYIANYSSSAQPKNYSVDAMTSGNANNTRTNVFIHGADFVSSVAITSVRLQAFLNFVSGSTASLYTITKA
jgi:hypothetical protein